MKRFSHMIAALLLLISFSTVGAQETEVAPEPTSTLGSIEITVTPGGEPVLPPDAPISDNGVSFSTLALLLLITAIAGIGAGAGIGTIVFQYLGRKDVRDTLEKLYLSASPETQRVILEQLGYARDTIEKLFAIINDVTNGQPNQEVIVAQVMERLQSEDKARWGTDLSKGIGG